MLRCARGRLDRGRAERRLAARREQHAVDAGRLRAAQQRPEVLGILERVEREDERRGVVTDRMGEDLVRGRETPGLHHQRHALVPVEPGGRRQGPALDLDDRDPQGGRVEHEPLERIAALGRHEQATRGAARDEGLLHGAPAGHELLVVGHHERRAGRTLGSAGCGPRAAVVERPVWTGAWDVDPG